MACAWRGGELAERAAFPAQDEVGVALAAVAVHGDVDLVEQGAQQLFAVPVGGGRCVPDLMQVVAEGQDGGTFGAGEGLGPEGLATGKLGLGFGHCLQRGLRLVSRPAERSGNAK